MMVGCGGDSAEAQDLLREGRYDAAIEAIQGEFSRAPTPAAAAELGRLFLLTGRLTEGATFLESALAQTPGAGELQLHLGRIYLAQGRRDDAEAILAPASQGSGGAALLARVHRGEVLLDRGRKEEALTLFDTFIDVYNASPSLDSRQLQAVATAVRHLGILNSALYSDALRAYDEAIALDPENLGAYLELGTLFLERYNLPEARTAFREVLSREASHPFALLGLARASEIEGSPDAGGLVDEALTMNRNLVPALVLRARLRIAGEDVAGATEDLNHALEVNPNSSAALGVLAGIHYLDGQSEPFERAQSRALEVNPRNAEFFVAMAEILSDGRFYAEAADFAGQGASLDSLSWEAFGAQGLNQLRVGEMEEGRRNLETAFAGDPFNVWYKNTLDLLDVIDEFQEFETPNFQIFVDAEDGAALAIYMSEIAERAYRDLSARYGFSPETPVRIEAFRRSGDFSVRTLGLTGLGALGVSFGPVVALDSPAARTGMDFNWASTLWHEISHTFHLGLTDHRVPRWFSEGLAVHEERIVAPGWGTRPSLAFFAAYLEEKVRVPSELSRSFSSPRIPEEVGYGYVMGSLVMEWIEEEWGFRAIRGMLDGYRELLPPAAVAERELGLSLPEFDRRFDQWIRERFADPIAAARAALELREVAEPSRITQEWLEERVRDSPMDVESRMALARQLLSTGDDDEAIPHLTRAREIFSENPDRQGPNRLLAQIYRERGDRRAAVTALRAYLAIVAEDREAQLELVELLTEEGDREGAAQAMTNAMLIYPFDLASHETLADLYREVGNREGEILERRVFLALNPPDRAGALFRLAEAQFAAGRIAEARTSVLGALEVAPRFPEAQDLLLRILGGG
jgi:tetratricopeptide (TPR) repeat protein